MTDLDDFPLALKRNVTVIELAQAIQHARADYYGHPHFDLNELPPSARDRYIDTAYTLMQRFAPEPAKADRLFQFAADSARAHFATGLHRPDGVIGVISPKGQQD